MRRKGHEEESGRAGGGGGKWGRGVCGKGVGGAEEGPAANYVGEVARYSGAVGLLTDICLGTLGGTLKRREKISGRLADAFAWLFVSQLTDPSALPPAV